ncbi:MAG: CHAD domain-containing protein, partial [Verrucomicrobiae bacterium]|nr:CHAD domain-containing protein [Verrucomicrobiae bacterium]
LSHEEIFTLVRQTLADEMAAWHALDDCDPAVARRTIRHQLRKSRDRARRDAHLAKRDHDPELWHDWRKMVKRLRYQREFIAATHGRLPGKIDARISRLGTRLGERNDLANLAVAADRLAASGSLERREHGLVRKAIAAEEHRLMRNCRRLGRQVSFKKGR